MDSRVKKKASTPSSTYKFKEFANSLHFSPGPQDHLEANCASSFLQSQCQIPSRFSKSNHMQQMEMNNTLANR